MLCLEPLFSTYARIADWEVAQTIKHQGELIQTTLDWMCGSRPWTGQLAAVVDRGRVYLPDRRYRPYEIPRWPLSSHYAINLYRPSRQACPHCLRKWLCGRALCLVPTLSGKQEKRFKLNLIFCLSRFI